MYYRIKRWIRWEARYFPRNFVKGVKNLIRWFPVIWKDRDWDSHYIWEILKFKLKNQSKHIGYYDRHVSAKRDVEIMMICVKLIDRIQNEYYSMEYMDYYKNEFHWDDCPDKPENKILRSEQISERFDEYFKLYPRVYKEVMSAEKTIFRTDDNAGIAMNIGNKNHQKAKKLLFKILENNIENWWD